MSTEEKALILEIGPRTDPIITKLSLFDVSAAEADKMLRDSARDSFALILRKE